MLFSNWKRAYFCMIIKCSELWLFVVLLDSCCIMIIVPQLTVHNMKNGCAGLSPGSSGTRGCGHRCQGGPCTVPERLSLGSTALHRGQTAWTC